MSRFTDLLFQFDRRMDRARTQSIEGESDFAQDLGKIKSDTTMDLETLVNEAVDESWLAGTAEHLAAKHVGNVIMAYLKR